MEVVGDNGARGYSGGCVIYLEEEEEEEDDEDDDDDDDDEELAVLALVVEGLVEGVLPLALALALEDELLLLLVPMSPEQRASSARAMGVSGRGGGERW